MEKVIEISISYYEIYEKWRFLIMKNKAIIILSLILLILMITSVSASETNTTDTISSNNLEISENIVI